MPFKSESQRRKFYELEKQGKMSKKTISAWESETLNKKLPERIGDKKSEVDPKRKGGRYK